MPRWIVHLVGELMKVRINIAELILNGFDYHDGKRIAAAIEHELARLIREKGLPDGLDGEMAKINAGSFDVKQGNARAVGGDIARAIYRALSDRAITMG